MKTKTRVLSLLLTLAMVLSSLIIMPITTTAASLEQWTAGSVTDLSIDADGAYLISTPEEWAYFAASVSDGTTYSGETVKLANDIDMAGKEMLTAGNNSKLFAGVFDGQGNKIDNVTFSKNYDSADAATQYTHLSLFGKLDGTAAAIKNLYVNVDITATALYFTGESTWIGHLCTSIYNGATVDNVHITMSTSEDGTTVYNANLKYGGFAGYIQGGSTISNSSINGTLNYKTVDANTCYFGGFAGRANQSNFVNCTNNLEFIVDQGAASDGVCRIGGFILFAQADGQEIKLTNCVNNGSIIAGATANNSYFSGFVAVANGDRGQSLTFTNCFDFGTYDILSGSSGSFLAFYESTASDKNQTFVNCFSSNNLKYIGTWSADAGKVAVVNGGAISNYPSSIAYFANSIMYQAPSTVTVGVSKDAWTLLAAEDSTLAASVEYCGETKTAPDTDDGSYCYFNFAMGEDANATKATLVLADTASDWKLTREMTVQLTDGNPWTNYAADSFAGGSGSSTDPYQISSGAELAYLSKLLRDETQYATYQALYYILTDNISLAGHEWVSIGERSPFDGSFKGTFDGKNYTISNLTYTSASNVSGTYQKIGLFAMNRGGTIKNFALNGSVDITYSSKDAAESGISLLCGKAAGWGLFSNIDVTGTINVTTSLSENPVGGICAVAHSVNISNCTMNGSITVSASGSGVIPCAGGFVGMPTKGLTITGSTNNADIAVYGWGGNSIVGGFVGKCGAIGETVDPAEFGVKISGCVNNGTISSNVVSGGTSPNNQRVGGFVGNVGRSCGGKETYVNVTIEKCINTGVIKIGSGVTIGSSSGIFPAYGYKEGSGTTTLDQFFDPYFEDATADDNAVNPYAPSKTFGTNADIRMAIDATPDGAGNAVIRVSKNAVDAFLAAGFTMNIVYGETALSYTAIPEDAVVGNNCYEITVAEQDAEPTMTMTKTVMGKTYTYTADVATWADFYTEAYTGTGTSEDPYVIDTAGKLGALALHIAKLGASSNMYFEIKGTIDLGAHEWLPIGLRHRSTATNCSNLWTTQDFNPSGILYGKDAVIQNVKMTADRYNYSQSFLGYSAWKISNLTFDGIYIEEAENVYGNINAVAGVVGAFYAGSMTNVHVKNLDLNADNNESTRYFGGVIGYIGSTGAISNCSVDGTIDITSSKSLNKVGGFASRSKVANVTNCTSDVDISVTAAPPAKGGIGVGGIVGIVDSDATTNVNNYTNCKYTGTINVKCSNAADVAYIGVGGIIGAIIRKGMATVNVTAGINDGKLTVSGDDSCSTVATGLVGYSVGYALNITDSLSTTTAELLGGSDGTTYTSTNSAAGVLEIATEGKASVRINKTSTEDSGLRFDSYIASDFYNAMKMASGEQFSVEIGTIVAPTLLIENDYAGFLANGVKVVYDVDTYKANGNGDDGFARIADGYSYFAGAIVNIKPSNYDLDFTAVAYVTVTINGTSYTYYADYAGEDDRARNVREVAQAAVNDRQETARVAENGVLYGTYVGDGNANGEYSPYSNAQLEVLNGYLA